MGDFVDAIPTAASLIVHLDAELRAIVLLSLSVSLSRCEGAQSTGS